MNKEEVRQRVKEWREKNPEKVKLWKEKNKEKIKEKKKKYYSLKAQFVLDYKKNKSCSNCGWNEHTEILQFHHTKGDKSFSVGSAIGNKKNEIIKKEMDKCVLLCPNCHFLLHYKKDNLLANEKKEEMKKILREGLKKQLGEAKYREMENTIEKTINQITLD